MAKIPVIKKSTGQQGLISEENYNPNEYERLTDLERVAQENWKVKQMGSELLPTIGQIGGGIIGGVPGAGIGGAIGEGLRQYSLGESADIGKVAKEAAIGAGTQFIGGKIGEFLTKGAGTAAEKAAETAAKEQNIIQKAGVGLQKSVTKAGAKIKASPRAASQIAEVEDLLDNYGLRIPGKAAQAKQAMIYEGALADSNAAVAASKLAPKGKALVSQAKLLVPEVSDLSGKVERTVVERLNSQLGKATSAQDLLDMKIDLMGKLQKTRLAGHINTPKEEIYQIYHDVVDNYLKTKIPQVKDSFAIMADMNKVSNAVGEAAKESGKGIKLPIPLIGKVGVGGGEKAQGAIVKAGQLLEKAGGGLPAIGGLNLPPTVGGLVAPGMQIAASGMGQPQGLPPATETGVPEIPQTEATPTTEQPSSGFTLEQLKNGYMNALMAGDKAAAAQIKAMYDMEASFQKTQGGGGKALTATQIRDLSDLKAGMKQMEELTGEISASGAGLMGPIAGGLRQLNPWDTDAQGFRGNMMLIVQNIGRALEGGVLRQEDVKKYQKILPQITDTPAVAQQKTRNVLAKLRLKYDEYVDQLNSASSVQSELPSPIEVAQ